MVVAITVAGVLLAGLQLLGSFVLATAGRGEVGSSSDVSLERNKLSVKSSVTGLGILAVSFAFYFVFVTLVFPFREDKVDDPARPAPVAAGPAPAVPGPLLPATGAPGLARGPAPGPAPAGGAVPPK